MLPAASPRSLALPNSAAHDRQSSDDASNVPVLPDELVVPAVSANRRHEFVQKSMILTELPQQPPTLHASSGDRVRLSSNSVMPYPTSPACMIMDVASKAETPANPEANIDVQSLQNSKEEPPRSLLDKLVLLTVVLGIVSFAAFQIIQCATAYAEPIFTSSLQSVPRVAPGVMICPYAKNWAGESFGCNSPQGLTPLWAPNAILSIDWWGNMPKCFVNSKSYSTTYDIAFLASLDQVSASKRSSCANFLKKDHPLVSSGGSPVLFFGLLNETSATGGNDQMCAFVSFARTVVVKNSAKSLNCTAAGCTTSRDSFTPPNVQCLVYDPSVFDDEAKKFGLDPKCNPMREVSANSLDSFMFRAALGGSTFDGPDAGKGYEFSGLRCSNQASKLKITLHDLQRQLDGGWASISASMQALGFSDMRNLSLFGNSVAVVYDSTKGIPNDLNFDDITAFSSEGAASSEKDGHILGFSVLRYLGAAEIHPYDLKQHKLPPIRVQSSLRMETRFTNAVLGRTKTTSTLSATILPSTFNPYRIPDMPMLMSFSTSDTVVGNAVISLSILTTISIIVSTAATLWGSQQKIKDGVRLVSAKVMQFYRDKDAQQKIKDEIILVVAKVKHGILLVVAKVKQLFAKPAASE
jgi:hypothetical protein